MLPAVRLTLPVLRIAVELPGLNVPPVFTVTVLLAVPVPPRVPPLLTVTGVTIEPLTISVPHSPSVTPP